MGGRLHSKPLFTQKFLHKNIPYHKILLNFYTVLPTAQHVVVLLLALCSVGLLPLSILPKLLISYKSTNLDGATC